MSSLGTNLFTLLVELSKPALVHATYFPYAFRALEVTGSDMLNMNHAVLIGSLLPRISYHFHDSGQSACLVLVFI